MQIIRLLFVLVFLSENVAQAALPPDAVMMLNSFPEKKVTLDLVLSRAMQSSDSYRAVESSLEAVDVAALRSRAALDSRIFAKTEFYDSKLEPTNAFSPNKSKGTSYTLGASTAFSTGTAANVEVTHGNFEIDFPTIPQNKYYESKVTASISQSLWADFFGYASRRAVQAGTAAELAAREAYLESREDWAQQLMQVFYGAWLAQSQAEAATESTKRRVRLVNITDIKIKRGTSERPDALQVQSALLNAKVQQSNADQALEDRWRGLVISLKLPAHWVDLNPREIPIGLDNPITEAVKGCERGIPQNTSATRKLKYQAEAARLNAERAESLASPDLKLVGGISANGIDTSSVSTTFEETQKLTYPAYRVGLNLSIPLSQSAEKAEVHSTKADRLRSEALSSAANENLRLDWLNACSDLKRLQKNHELLVEAFESQTRRLALEEQRFQVGRSNTLSVIQAGDDVTAAEIAVRNSEVTRRLAAWRVRRMIDGFQPYLEKLAQSEGGLK